MITSRSALVLAVALQLAGVITIRAQQPDPVTFLSQADLAAMLVKAADPARGLTTARVSNTKQYQISVQQRTKVLGAVLHEKQPEVHYIVKGSGTLVTGGELRRPDSSAGGAIVTIAGGESRRVSPGDVIVIPPNTPHWYSAIDGEVTFLEVRWDAVTAP